MLPFRYCGRFGRTIWFRSRTNHRTLCSQNEETPDDRSDVLPSDHEYNHIAEHYFHLKEAHKCLIIQPYVKWGRKKLTITPEEQLSEAIALINTLPAWKVKDTVTVPMDNLERKTLFKSGTMDRIKNLVQDNSDITAIFVNSSSINKSTTSILQDNFKRPILDRYKVVMQILKAHATSKHAKLQVALAELYYIQRKSEKDLMFKTYNTEALRLMFNEREKKIKNQINSLRNQRNLLRNNRKRMEFPIVAVVGYTNAGKTSLIKSLTGEQALTPKNQLFATLDVTAHAGQLPSGLEVLFIDTVGFISDIPTTLIECFVATLEDALLADVILHIEDISSESYEYRRQHVVKTLEQLEKQVGCKNIMSKVISVGNKCDLLDGRDIKDANVLLVSADKGIGLEKLRNQLEESVLYRTDRQQIVINIPNSGDEMRWLYKNATILDAIPDPKDLQSVSVKAIITKASLAKFKHTFI